MPKQSFRVSKYGGYQPKRVTDYKKLAHLIGSNAAKKQGWKKAEGPLLLKMVFRFRCPSSARKSDKSKERWRISRPDLDNLEKSITDAIAATMVDDSQVCLKLTLKITAKDGDEEGTSVTLEKLGEYNEGYEEVVGRSLQPTNRQGPDEP